jgi:hypothetical protein
VRLDLQLPGELLERLAHLAAAAPCPCSCLLTTGPGPVVPGLFVLVLVVYRHDRHLHPCLSGVQPNRERWNTKKPVQTLDAVAHIAVGGRHSRSAMNFSQP